MSLPIHIGQMESVGEGHIAVVEVREDYTRRGDMEGTITLKFWGNIFAGATPTSPRNHLGIPLADAPAIVPSPTPLQHLMQPFTRKVSA